MNKPKCILMIEDEADISELLQFNLERGGYKVRAVANGEEGLISAQQNPPDLILLDIMLPGCDGLTVLRGLRESSSPARKVPVIMLTAKGEESDIVVGLELGADDYMAKPFSPRELVARVKAVLRRGEVAERQSAVAQTRRVTAGPVTVDLDRHEVWIDSKPVQFTLAEFNLLATLLSRPGRVFTRDQLLEKITGGETFVIDRNVDVHIRAIRKKMELDSEFIQTVRGVGYKCREL